MSSESTLRRMARATPRRVPADTSSKTTRAAGAGSNRNRRARAEVLMDRVAAHALSVESRTVFSTPGTNLKPPGLVGGSVHDDGWRRTRKDRERWKQHGCPFPDDDRGDVRLARARELVALGYLDMAFNVFTCGSWRCNERWCPRCGRARTGNHKVFVSQVHRRMKAPVLALFKVYSRRFTKPALDAAYDALRSGIRAVSRCKSMCSVRRAVGRIEAVPTILGGKMVWLAHAHVLLDVDGVLDDAPVREDFRRVTRKKNSFFGFQTIESHSAIVEYITKARDVCPDPGMPIEHLAHLMGAFRHKELLLSWGVGGRGRKAGAKRARPDTVSPFVPTSAKLTDVVGDGGRRPSFVWRVRSPRRGRLASGVRKLRSSGPVVR